MWPLAYSKWKAKIIPSPAIRVTPINKIRRMLILAMVARAPRRAGMRSSVMVVLPVPRDRLVASARIINA